MADGMNEHREIAVIESQPSRGTRALAAGSLWVCWVVSIFPVVALVLEFGQRQIEDCGAEWWYNATFYSHFFIYPVTFGLVSTVFLHRPWIRVVHYLRSLTGPAKTKHIIFIMSSMLVVVVFMCYVEFSRAPQGSAAVNCPSANFTEPARSLWDLAPDAMTGNEVKGVHTLIAMQCRGEPLTSDQKCEYGQKMAELWEAGSRRYSYTERAYRVGFVTMTSLFVFLFAAIAIVRSWKPKIRSRPEGKRIAGMLLLALSFATGWVFMRLLYLWEKSLLYPEDPQWAFDILILGIFFVFLLHAAACRWSRIARHDRILQRIISISSIVVFYVILSRESSPSVTEGFVVIVVACFLFSFASSFPSFLKGLLNKGVLITLVIVFAKWWRDAFVPWREVLDEDDV